MGKRWTFGIILALLALLLAVVMAVFWLRPPGTMTIAAGPQGGAYHQIATRYRTILARDGIDLKIVETAGSVENAALISSGEVDAAIVQGGINVPGPDIEAIGKMFYEPIVFLSNTHAQVSKNPTRWRGLRINVGTPGSGASATWRDFARVVGLDRSANEEFQYPFYRAIKALENGDIDLAIFVAPIDAPYLLKAYQSQSLRLQSVQNVEAISRRLVYARTVSLPAGGISLQPTMPAASRMMIALEGRLVVAGDLHPALVNRLTMAAIELHQSRGMLTDEGTFPSVEGLGMTVNNAARQLVINGPSVWHDWLPYWMASQVYRVVLLLVPVLFVLVPILRLVPSAYAFLMRWRVWQFYPEIRAIEAELDERPETSDLASVEDRLDGIEERLSGLRLPPAYRKTAYDARLHIGLVRARIKKMNQA